MALLLINYDIYIDPLFFQPVGFLADLAIPYSNLEAVYVVQRWDVNQKFCIRLVVPDGSTLLQVRYILNMLEMNL